MRASPIPSQLPGITLFPALELTALSLAGAPPPFFTGYRGFFHRPGDRILRGLFWRQILI